MDPAEIAQLKELAQKEKMNVINDGDSDLFKTEDDEKREENDKAAAEAAKDLDVDLGISEEEEGEKSTKNSDYFEEQDNYVRSKARQQIRK
jgi:hypothetical protein